MYNTNCYFEARITIDPVLCPNRLNTLRNLIYSHDFRLTKLYMDKGQPSTLDSFMTCRDKYYDNILNKTLRTVDELEATGFTVKRYEIGNVLLDVRINQPSSEHS